MRRYKILDSTKKIVRRDLRGSYEVLSADGDLRDGVRGSLNIRDEIHRWKTAKAETLRDVLTKGQISRREPLDIQVTTAGAEYESPMWYSEYEYAKRVQAEPSINPHHYVMIFEADAKRLEEDPRLLAVPRFASRRQPVARRPRRPLDRPGHRGRDEQGQGKRRGALEILQVSLERPDQNGRRPGHRYPEVAGVRRRRRPAHGAAVRRGPRSSRRGASRAGRASRESTLRGPSI
jgi:hypothetical protein